MSQAEMPLLGLVSRPLIEATAQEMACVKCMSDAVDLCLRKARMNYAELAGEIGVSKSYLSMLMNGTRRWQCHHIERVIAATRCLAPHQYSASRLGVDVYVDPVKVELAQAERRVQELRAQVA